MGGGPPYGKGCSAENLTTWRDRNMNAEENCTRNQCRNLTKRQSSETNQMGKKRAF